MRTADFLYDLPPELIAQRPLAERRASRLLVLDGRDGHLADRRFAELGALLRAGDLLVFNDTRVIPARLTGRKSSGGRVELLLERLLPGREVLAQLRASKPSRAGTRLRLGEGLEAEVLGREGEMYRLRLGGEAPVPELLEAHGHVPLPPYIQRGDEAVDRERYQTVYARRPGAVAAPTAGLHFDQALMAELKAAGVAMAQLTLHVGAGTFQPVRTERVEDHRLHAEWVEVDEAVCAAVAQARRGGGRVVAVGTTTVRALESASAGGEPRPFAGDTRLFIYPGYRFRCVDALITNFHLPGSSLLMLVAAFAGRDAVMAAYRHAVAQRYRFYSYGDAMLVTRAPGAGRA